MLARLVAWMRCHWLGAPPPRLVLVPVVVSREMGTRRLCCCDTRRTAQRAGDFLPIGGGEWVFTGGTFRHMSEKAKYYAFVDRRQCSHVDHSGEPPTWECCPWCGGDLPGTIAYYGPSIGQADGGEGAE